MVSFLSKAWMVVAVYLAAFAGIQGRFYEAWGSAREEALERRLDVLHWQLDGLQEDTKDVANQLSTLRVQLVRFRMALRAKLDGTGEVSELAETREDVFDWKELDQDVEDILEDDEILTQVFLDVAKVFDFASGDMTKAERGELASSALPIMEGLVNSGGRNRWKDDALFAAVYSYTYGSRGDHNQLGKALQYLNQLWDMRDQVGIEDELRETPIYERILLVEIRQTMKRDGMDLSQADPASVSIKLGMVDTYKRMGRLADAERSLNEAYELAGRPQKGELSQMFLNLKTDLDSRREAQQQGGAR